MRQTTRIGLMSFTVRKQMKTCRQIRTTMKELKTLSINGLELAYIKWKSDRVEALAESCRSLNMVVFSSQIKYKTIVHHYDQILAYQRMLACDTIAVSVLPNRYLLKGEQGIRDFAVQLNQLGERLFKDGIHLLFHHHHMEFTKYHHQTGLDILMDMTNPTYVNLEMDVYWTQIGGKNPLDMIELYKERIKVIHLRDYQVNLKWFKGDFVVSNDSLGHGNLDVDAIVKKAIECHIRFLAFEQDTKTPISSIKESISYLSSLGYRPFF